MRGGAGDAPAGAADRFWTRPTIAQAAAPAPYLASSSNRCCWFSCRFTCGRGGVSEQSWSFFKAVSARMGTGQGGLIRGRRVACRAR